MEPQVFRAETMMEALQLVQEQLGPDAIVLSARDLPKSSLWQYGKTSGVEIAAVPGPAGHAQPKLPAVEPSTKTNGEGARRWQPRHITREELAALQTAVVEAVSAQLPAAPAPAEARTVAEREPSQPAEQPAAAEEPTPKRAPLTALQRAAQVLQSQGLDPQYIARLVQTAEGTLSTGKRLDDQTCHTFLTRQIAADLKTLAPEQLAHERVICLVGTSGSGKTSTAARLALFSARMQRQNVVWVCVDTFRASAVAEARSYTQALNIPLCLAYRPEDLPAILAQQTGADRIIIDTPGLNPWNETKIAEIAAFLSELPSALKLLTAPATVKFADLQQAATALDLFGLNGTIFSKLDETRSYGNLVELGRQTRLPMAFFTSGRESDRGLEPASPARLAAALFGKGWN